ncbi:hypothetical protein ACWGI0_27985 [Streptomyces sp. NPDC054802]
MTDQQQGQDTAWETRRRRVGIGGFVGGVVVALGFFAFFPGLPHVIDSGAVVVSLVVGGITRWAVQRRLDGRRP